MQRSLMAFVLLTVLLAPAPGAMAADKEGYYWAQRPSGCREFRDSRRSQEVIPAVRSWVAGYITAYSRQTPDTYNVLGITEFESVIGLIEKYCKANPFKNVADAMEAITEELHPRRYRTKREAGR